MFAIVLGGLTAGGDNILSEALLGYEKCRMLRDLV